MKTLVYTALAAVTLGSLAACSTAAAPSRTTPPPTRPAASSAPGATVAAAPKPSACEPVLATLKSAESAAQSEATAKHAQYPGISVASLEGAAFANELTGAAGEKAAAVAGTSGSVKLASAGKALAADARVMHDYYGESRGDQATRRVQADLTAIAGVCGNG